MGDININKAERSVVW